MAQTTTTETKEAFISALEAVSEESHFRHVIDRIENVVHAVKSSTPKGTAFSWFSKLEDYSVETYQFDSLNFERPLWMPGIREIEILGRKAFLNSSQVNTYATVIHSDARTLVTFDGWHLTAYHLI